MLRAVVRWSVGVWALLSAVLSVAMLLAPLIPSVEIAFQSDRDGQHDLYLMDIEQRFVVRLTASRALEIRPRWSPDGRRLAFAANPDGSWDIFVLDIDGLRLHRLTADAANNSLPTWSPDGAYIAFESDRDGLKRLYLMRADGSDMRPLTYGGVTWNDTQPAWWPGADLLFISDRDGWRDVYRLTVAEGAVRRLTYDAANDGAPEWGPDGRSFAWASERDLSVDDCSGLVGLSQRCLLHVDMYVMRADGAVVKLTEKSGGYWSPSFSPDGAWLLFAGEARRRLQLFLAPTAGGALHQITDGDFSNTYPAWRP